MMSDWRCEVPIVFFIFRRTETTRRVFAEIARAKPRKLFIVADAPTPGNLTEEKACRETRAVVENISWNCEVFRDYAQTRRGLDANIYRGLDWVFEKEERAIILEDDVLPDPSFFRFAQELLERYSEDSRVFHINGSGYMPLTNRDSYYFSIYPGSWGWATWRRAWHSMDKNISEWPARRKQGWLREKFKSRRLAASWENIFDLAFQKKAYWDTCWQFHIWRHDKLCVTPASNLISNIGFGTGATNAQNPKWSARPLEPISFPLKHPHEIAPNFEVERKIEQQHESFFSLTWSLKTWLKLKMKRKHLESLRHVRRLLMGLRRSASHV